MKRIFLSLIILLLSITSIDAQIIKKFTTTEFPDGIYGSIWHVTTYLTGFDSDGSVNVEKFYKHESNKITFYNLDFSIYKTTIITVPDNSTSDDLRYVTTKLFNDDDLIEFLYGYYVNNTPYYKLMNENNEVLFDFGNACPTDLFVNSNGEFMLVMYSPSSKETILYSLGTTLPTGLSPINLIQSEKNPYPNPSKSIINLPYQLEQGNKAIMKIYDVNGKQITTKQIDASFDKILLDVSGYTKGMYMYEYNGKKGKFLVE